MRGRAALAGVLVALAGLLVPFTAPATAGVAGQVAQARAATHTFTHPGAAQKKGYALLKDAKGIACIAMKGMGAMGVHYANGSLVDGKIQLRHPEALVYRFTFNGHLQAGRTGVPRPAQGLARPPRDRTADALRPPVQLHPGGQPLRPPGVLLAARLGLVPQPGRSLPDVQPAGALPRRDLGGRSVTPGACPG